MLKMVSINHNKCSGCHLCQLICSYTKTQKFDEHKSRINIIERDKPGFTQMICRNCIDAPCMDACPAGALRVRKEDGYVILNEDKCVGCNMCVMVCPFNAIESSNHKNYKCDTCNGEERCAKICSQNAIEFVDLEKSNKKKKAQTLARMYKGCD